MGRASSTATGLVNGTGMVNGTSMGGRRSSRRADRHASLTRWQFLAVLIALLIIIPTFVYLSYYSDDGPYDIDGDFDEWADATTFSMFSQSTSESLNVEEWAVAIDGADLYFYVDAQGDMMASSMVESMFLFVDIDGSSGTGYSVGGLGAEYLLETDGWNGTVQTTAMYTFTSDDDQYDWSAWTRSGSVTGRLTADEMEAMATLDEMVGPSSEFLLLTQDQLERRAVSHAVPASGGVLIVKQELTPSVFSDGVVRVVCKRPAPQTHLLGRGRERDGQFCESSRRRLRLAFRSPRVLTIARTDPDC